MSVEEEIFKNFRRKEKIVAQERESDVSPSKPCHLTEYVEKDYSKDDLVVKREAETSKAKCEKFYTKTEYEGILQVHKLSPVGAKNSFSGGNQQLKELVERNRDHLEFTGGLIICKLCKKEMNSNLPLMEHLLGKVHKKNSRI